MLAMLAMSTTSCATRLEKFSYGNDQKELIETFDLNKEKFNKFKSAPIPKEEKEEEEDKKSDDKKKGNKDRPQQRPRKKKKENEKKKVESRYPQDYPQELKEYDKKFSRAWKEYIPYVFQGEEFTLRIVFLGATVGHIKMTTQPLIRIAGKTAYYFKARLKSAKFYEFVYKLDDTIESYIDQKEFLPIKYTLIQRESSQEVDDLQLFDRENLKTYFWYKRIKRGKLKNDKRIVHMPYYVQDSFSVIFFVRGLPLQAGRQFEFPVITRGKIWLLKMKVVGEEEIYVNGEMLKAIKIKAKTRLPGTLKKEREIVLWYSADEQRRILKFKAKVKIGFVKGELVDYKSGQPYGTGKYSKRRF